MLLDPVCFVIETNPSRQNLGSLQGCHGNGTDIFMHMNSAICQDFNQADI
jgi:hypothetical protein